MLFEALVDRLVSLFDCSQQRAVDVTNERLQRLVTESGSLRAIKAVSASTTVANQTSYAIDPTVIQIYKVRIDFTAGTMVYVGAETLEDFWDVDVGDAVTRGNWFAIEPDADSLGTTDNLRLYPAPTEAGKAINGLVALQPATLTYTSNTALPIPLDVHEHLLAGCKAELYDEDDRQDESQKDEAVFVAGIAKLKKRVESRGKGLEGHRMRVRGYDFSPHGAPHWS
jgi:hypothetical protein